MDRAAAAELARRLDGADHGGSRVFPGRLASGVAPLRTDRILLLCSRQLGKSTSTAILALNEACYRDNSLVLLVSRSERQSTLLFEKVGAFFKRLRPVDAVKELSLSIKLANGSEIVALPGDGDTIRGFSDPRLIILDEASRIPDSVLAAVVPMTVVSGGRIVALSTPRGRTGFFYDLWSSRNPRWERIEGRASQSQRISREAIEEQRTTMGPRLFAAEFDNEFLEDWDSVFSAEAIASIFA